MNDFSILVSSNERALVKQTLGSIGIEANIPYDFQIYTDRGLIGVERKAFPEDFLASVRDGRLAKECAAMRETAQFRIVIIEGKASYTADDLLRIGGRISEHWTKVGIRNLRRSIRYVEGADIEDSENIADTIEVLKELYHYFDKNHHVSLRTRPKIESSWPTATYEERLAHFYQGLPGISAILAGKLAEHFPSPMALFSAQVEDIEALDLFGKSRASKIIGFLRGESN